MEMVYLAAHTVLILSSSMKFLLPPSKTFSFCSTSNMSTHSRFLLLCTLFILLLNSCQTTSTADPQNLHLGWFWPNETYRLQGAMAIGNDGTIYVIDAESTLHAIDKNGKQLWSYHDDYGNASAATLSQDGKALYFVTDTDILYALSLQGQPLWGVQSSQPFVAMPNVAPNGYIYVQTYGGGFRISPSGEAQAFPWPLTLVDQISFDAQSRLYLHAATSPTEGFAIVLSDTGSLLAQCPLSERSYGPRPIGKDAWLYTDTQGGLHVIDFACQPLWSDPGSQTFSETTTYPALTINQTIYLASAQAQVLALSNQGQRLWAASLAPGRGPVTHLQAIGTNILAITSDGYLTLLSNDGQPLWSEWLYEAGSPGIPQPTPQGGFAIIQNGRLLLYTPNSAQRYNYPQPTPPPTTPGDAAVEIKIATFEYIFSQWIDPLQQEGNTNPSLIAFAPPADPASLNDHQQYLDRQHPFQVWKYTDDKITEAKDPAAALSSFLAAQNDPNTPPWQYYEFGILQIEDNLQYASVFIASQCGEDCDQGALYTLHRSPSGVWWVVDQQTLWHE
jgi:hypothetical protein